MSRPNQFVLIGVAACFVSIGSAAPTAARQNAPQETSKQHDARMAWWREARFGMFIHWGLYSIPAGQWKGSTQHAEWIRHTAHIPVAEYEKFVQQFNPVKFDADEWVGMAKDAGMKYIVITSKHHDGFCLFDSKYTDFDIMSTPFKRDIMKELSQACRRAGLKMCWYHSIMDWHHPDYLPRRPWEKEDRPAGDADLDRYIAHMKNQVRELLTHYGPIGVMWFDGEWESTWKHENGVDLYNFVRSISPDTIINNRVDKGRSGMAGMTIDRRYKGDFGTPEQEIPATGLPGADWETCMTMNGHWGFNKNDQNWKSTADLIRKLADIASKGGNFLLNVGPTAAGAFPPQSIDRLRGIGRWMKINGDAIYGTSASPFATLAWGRCTQRSPAGGDTRLYLHVFDWPGDGRLVVPGILNEPRRAFVLAEADHRPLETIRSEDALVIRLPAEAPDPIDSVVVLDIAGRADIAVPPHISAKRDIFIDALDVNVSSDREYVELRYTTDGSEPNADSPRVIGPIRLANTADISARAFRGERAVSPTARAHFDRVIPRPGVNLPGMVSGIRYEYFEGQWDRLPDFDALKPVKSGLVDNFSFSPRDNQERFGFRYRGYIRLPRAGIYTFYTNSDDGSQLRIHDQLVVDNDGLHGMSEKSGAIALTAGTHAITVTFFEKTGGDGLEISYEGPGIKKQRIPSSVLLHRAK